MANSLLNDGLSHPHKSGYRGTKHTPPIVEVMREDRFTKDCWERVEAYEPRFRCPTCGHIFTVDCWFGRPYWKFCPLCGKPKEV